MKKIKIATLALICLVTISCGNMNQIMGAMSGKGAINAITSVIGLDKLSAKGLIGSWRYSRPGITSDNTYIIFNEDGTFSAKILGTPLKGTYTFDEAAAKITLKTMLFSTNCYAKREYGGISVLFEANKLLTLLQTIAAFSGNQNLQAIGDISKQYDGVRIGFDMTK